MGSGYKGGRDPVCVGMESRSRKQQNFIMPRTDFRVFYRSGKHTRLLIGQLLLAAGRSQKYKKITAQALARSHLEGAPVLSLEQRHQQREDRAQELPLPLERLRRHQQGRLARSLPDPLPSRVQLGRRLGGFGFGIFLSDSLRFPGRGDVGEERKKKHGTPSNKRGAFGRPVQRGGQVLPIQWLIYYRSTTRTGREGCRYADTADASPIILSPEASGPSRRGSTRLKFLKSFVHDTTNNISNSSRQPSNLRVYGRVKKTTAGVLCGHVHQPSFFCSSPAASPPS